MMNRIIIIDDRLDNRDKPNLSVSALEKLKEMSQKGDITITLGIDCSLPIESILKDYSLIAIHRSYLVNKNLYNTVYDFVKKTNKYLIIFSGGINPNTIRQNGHLLFIEASDFYSDSLPIFLEDFGKNEIQYPLLKFLYGNSWRLTLLLEYRFFLWYYGYIDDIEDIEDEDDYERVKVLIKLLWESDSLITIERTNEEIEIEKSKSINS